MTDTENSSQLKWDLVEDGHLRAETGSDFLVYDIIFTSDGQVSWQGWHEWAYVGSVEAAKAAAQTEFDEWKSGTGRGMQA